MLGMSFPTRSAKNASSNMTKDAEVDNNDGGGDQNKTIKRLPYVSNSNKEMSYLVR